MTDGTGKQKSAKSEKLEKSEFSPFWKAAMKWAAADFYC
jgi:hypothetical protein